MLSLKYHCSISKSLKTAGNVEITDGSLSYGVGFCISSTSSVSARLNFPASDFGVLDFFEDIWKDAAMEVVAKVFPF